MKQFILLVLFVGGLTVIANAQNMVVYDDALENGWVSDGWAALNYANKSPVRTGSNSIGVSDTIGNYQAIMLQHGVLDPSLYQSLSFWIYPTVAKTNELLIQAGILTGTVRTMQTQYFQTISSDQLNQWQQITVPLSSLGVSGSTGFDSFWIMNMTGSPLTFYLDDISLNTIPAPNPVPVTIDAQSVVRTIDNRLFGMNLTMWDSYLSSSTTATLLAAMGSTTLRFPGGSQSDGYDWQTGLTYNGGSYKWPGNAAVFAGLVSAQGAQAYVTVNYGTGTPEQAAAWVAYYNGSTTGTAVIGVDSKGRDWKTVGYWATIRASAPLGTNDGYNFLRISHPAPYGFKYWEIGNEDWGNWETDLHGTNGSGLSGAPHDAYTYGRTFPSFYNKMLAVDPTLHIGAVATVGEDWYASGSNAVPNPNEGNSLHTGWTPVMLNTIKSLGVTPHFLIYHIYPETSGSETDWGLLQQGSTLAWTALNLRQMVTDYIGGTSGSSIELVMTELNSVSPTPGKQTTSLVDGLFLADALGAIAGTEYNACAWWCLRDNGSSNGNNSASLYGSRSYGAYGVVSIGNTTTTTVPVNTPFAPFYAEKLLTHWGRGGDCLVGVANSYSYLAVYPAKLLNGSLALLVINKHPYADLPVQFTLNNYTPGSLSAQILSYGKTNDAAGSDLTTGTISISGTVVNYTFPSYSMSVLLVRSPFEFWREQYFTATALNNWSYSGDKGNPSGDGISNLIKYALNLNPMTASSGPGGFPVASVATTGSGNYLTLSYTKVTAAGDITYLPEVSGDMQTWNSGTAYTAQVSVTANPGGLTQTVVVQDLTPFTGASKRFMRLRITRR